VALSRIHLTKFDLGTFAAKPVDFLERDRFNRYLELLGSSFSYSPATRSNYGGYEHLPAVVSRLTAEGFRVTADQALLDHLEGEAIALEALADQADARAREAAAEVAARGLTLYPFQNEGARWLRERAKEGKNALLADQMGLGKTIQALAALPDKAPVVVVCPASVKLNWRAEIRRWRPDLDPRIVQGKRSFYTPKAGQVVIANYDLLLDRPDALAFEPGTFLIVDEAHLVKNRQAARSKRVRALRETLDERGGRTWFLTGTPLLNYPMELWSVLDCLGVAREAFETPTRFRRLYHASANSWGGTDYGQTDEADRSHIAQALRRVSLMRLRHQVMPELPGKQRSDVPVEIDAKTDAMLDETLAKLRDLGVDLEGAASFAEACKGRSGEAAKVAFELISKARAAVATAKIPAALETVEAYEEAGEPLLVFSCHLAPVEAVATRPGWAKITGETTTEARNEIVERFQRGELKGVALTVRAGGVGLTLTKAANVLFVDLDWTPALNSQAEDRVCRIGQTRGVQITRLVADHALDRRLAELLTLKEEHVATVERSAVQAVTASGSQAKRTAVAVLRSLRTTLEVQEAATTAEAAAGPLKPAAGPGVATVRITTADGRTFNVTTRPPKDDAERHAGNAVVKLAGLSPDGCAIRNDEGFSAADLEFGMSLAKTYAEHGGLSDGQWRIALKFAHKYRRQVGAAPTAASA
jgi:hypothetical protein